MKELSIFADESGDLGPYSPHSPYYIVTLVLHDQTHDIVPCVERLDSELTSMGLCGHTIHTAPLIRKEEDYANMSPQKRRKIFSLLYHFAMKCDISFTSFCFNKKELDAAATLEGRINRELASFLDAHLAFFQSFDKVILYYDNGQPVLSRSLGRALTAKLAAHDSRTVSPSNYKLFQVADLICTIELIRAKAKDRGLSRSEELIFHSARDFKKDFGTRLHKQKQLL